MRRVYHKWQDVIEGTLSLKKIIFLAPQQLDHEWHCQPSHIRHPNPDHSMVLVKQPIGSGRNRDTQVINAAYLNPVLLYKKSENAEIPIWYPWQYGYGGHPRFWTSEELCFRMDVRPKHVRTNSALLNMFITHPPLFEITLRTRDTDHRKSSRRIQNPKGLKVIDVLRATEQLSGNKAVVVEHVFFPSPGVDILEWNVWQDLFYTDT